MSPTSNCTCDDPAAPTEAHGVRNFAETTTVRSTSPTPTPLTLPPQTGMAGVEALLQRLLPGTSVASRVAG